MMILTVRQAQMASTKSRSAIVRCSDHYRLLGWKTQACYSTGVCPERCSSVAGAESARARYERGSMQRQTPERKSRSSSIARVRRIDASTNSFDNDAWVQPLSAGRPSKVLVGICSRCNSGLRFRSDGRTDAVGTMLLICRRHAGKGTDVMRFARLLRQRG